MRSVDANADRYGIRRTETGGISAASRVARVAAPAGAFVAVLALIASRRPDALTRPQFWAEDGGVWFAAAYNHGALASLLTPSAAYFQTFSRLSAAGGVLVGLRHAPLLFAAGALVAQALPVLYVLSSRMAGVLPDRRVRALAALLLVGLPNSFEVQINVTNAQTHFALLGFLIVVADAPPGRAWAALDLALLALGGLSGPTYVFLVPVALAAWWRERTPWRAAVGAVVAGVSAVQTLGFLIDTGGGRFTSALGASPGRFLGIVGGHVVLGGLASSTVHGALVRPGGDAPLLVAALGLVGVLVLVRAVLVSGNFPLRALALFAALVMAAALSSPAVGHVPRWQALQWPLVGGRYWFMPTVALLAALVWSAFRDPRRAGRALSLVALAVVLLVGVPLDWRVAPRPDLRFVQHVTRFEAAAPGTVVTIPIPPQGWTMSLRKR
jgi:hypothetical protein